MNRYDINDKTSYCLGMSLTIEALKHRPECLKSIILSTKAKNNKQFLYLCNLCDEYQISIEYDDKLIDKLSLKENCYCIGIFEKFYHNLKSNKHLVLYGFNDYGELGTVLRSAISFNFSDIVLINSDLDYYDPRCIRASMGAIFHTNIVRYNKIDDYLKDYPNICIYAFTSNGANELSKMILDDNYGLLISQNYYELDEKFENSYHLKHKNLEEISLSVRSSIILSYAYASNRNL